MGVERVTVDFHCHSSLSDGTLTPEALADLLAAEGVAFAALTDHDTMDGSIRFREALTRKGIGCVNGVEITTAFDDGEIHILGYGVDPANAALRDALASSRRHNDPGVQGLVDSLKHLGMRGEQQRAEQMEAVTAIALVHAAGGIAFLAHPLTPPRAQSALEALVRELKEAGLDGLEALYRPYADADQARLLRIAESNGLAVCAGSDFHGIGIPGQSAAGVKMDARLWRTFREALLRVPAQLRENRRVEVPPLAHRGGFPARIVIPTVLAAALFVVSIFAIIIPRFEAILLEKKKDTIRELTNSVVSVIAEFAADEKAGRLSHEEAQKSAAARVRDIRYGAEGKDYFWITDMHPTMIMHPYREDLVGKDVGGYADANGVRVFVEFVKAVREKSEGYVEYLWQWKDDASRIVPKLSFVKRFAPWDWVIGTGIYLDDVRTEIDGLTRRLIRLSAGIVVILALLLAFVVQQGLAVERRRRTAELGLRESHEKYRALVEASTEGMVMVVDGACRFANTVFLDMIGYAESELALLSVSDLVVAADGTEEEVRLFLQGVATGASTPPPACECRLRARSGTLKDAVLSASAFDIGDRDAHGTSAWIISVRDMSAWRRAEAGMGQSRYAILADASPLGVFRASWGRKAVLLEANAAARKIFGIAAAADVTQVGFFSLAASPEDAEQLYEELASAGSVVRRALRITQVGGEPVTISLSAVVPREALGAARHLEGMVEDITEQLRAQRRSEELIAELETSSLYLNDSVARLSLPFGSCDMEAPVRRAAHQMTRTGHDALLVTGGSGAVLGIVTDRDMRERVVGGATGLDAPVREIMSAPLAWIPDTALLSEAVILMRDRDIGHLAVRGSSGAIVGILRGRDLLQLHRHSVAVMQQEIHDVDSVAELTEIPGRLPALVEALLASGARSRNISRVITSLSDQVVGRLIGFAIAELGPPPAAYAFVALGSDGRQERGLRSDQDNALVFADAAAGPYFLCLGEKVCRWLDGMGVPLCKGGVMAMNPSWCVPLETWEAYFSRWILEPNPQELLDFNIFFDFRCVAGDARLTESLRATIARLLHGNPPFFLHLARDAMQKRLPPHLSGGILRDVLKTGFTTLDLKDAMAPLVAFSRLYALRHGVMATNTFERLSALREMNVLKASTADDILEAYAFLMQLRLARADTVDLRSLTHTEEITLRHALAQLSLAHKKIAFDFPGSAL
jgi:PAS domain S-box-containing protein